MEKEYITEAQKSSLAELVKTNEETKGCRIVIDYAISAICQFCDFHDYGRIRKEMEDFVEELYRQKYSS